MRSGWRGRAAAAVFVLAFLTLSGLPGQGAASPFTARVQLPRLADGEFYQLLSDRYAMRRSIHDNELGVLDLFAGRQLWRRELTTVFSRGGEQLILGVQSRSGTVAPGAPMATFQFVEAATGRVVADIGVWRIIRRVADRLWVGLFASRGTGTLMTGPEGDAQQEAILGYVDLRPGSPLAVTTVGSLGDAYEDCDFDCDFDCDCDCDCDYDFDFDFGWLLCTNSVTDVQPVAIRYPTAPTA